MTEEDRKGADDGFSTDWIEVRRASDISTDEGKAALVRLVERYSPGLKAYLSGHFRFGQDEVDDIFQTFIEKRILKDRLIARADQSRGSFRAFLLSAVHNFALSDLRQRSSQKRLPEHKLVSLDDVSDKEMPAQFDEVGETAEFVWAQAVIAGALLDMHNELNRTGRSDIWELFVGRVLQPLLQDEPPPTYASLVEQFGFKSPAQALNTLVTAKRMFRRHLRAVIVQYTGDASVADDELAHLKHVLGKHPKR